MLKSISLVIVSLAMVTACAHPLTTVMEERAASGQQALYGASISAGACDKVGQFIRDAHQPITLRQEASAMPVHD